MINEYGRLMLDIEGKSLSEEDKNIISSSPVGGIIFFSKNFESYEQIMGNKNKSYRAFVLVLLTIVYGFNFIDRQIVGILAPFIQKDLGLTNTELGLLIGLAFAVLYAP